MNKLLTKIVGVVLGTTMAVGVGVGVAVNNNRDVVESQVEAAGKNDWVQVTSLSGINSTDKYVIANNADKGYYFDGTVDSGHLQTDSFGASAPSGNNAAGVVQFEGGTNNIWKIKLVSTGNYVTATKASSGGGKVNATSDSSGWLFKYNNGFNATYQSAFSGNYAGLRCYNNTTFRTYSAGSSASGTASSGTVFRLYKYQAAATLSSIAVTTPPTKTSYAVGESFDSAGMVVTATYSDSSTKDVTSSCTFTPAVIQSNTTSITISFTDGTTETTTQSITVLTVSTVTLNGDMNNKDYVEGEAWDVTGLYLTVTYSPSGSSTVQLTSLVKDTDYLFDHDIAVLGDTEIYISGSYLDVDFDKTVTGITVSEAPISDVLRTGNTSLPVGTSGSYTAFSGRTKSNSTDITSNATWAGTAAYSTAQATKGALQLNGTSRAVYTTASDQYVKTVSVVYSNDNGASLKFYGSNTAYSAINANIASDTNSTLIATLNKDTTSVTISGNYKYIYFHSTATTYISYVTVEWKKPVPTLALSSSSVQVLAGEENSSIKVTVENITGTIDYSFEIVSGTVLTANDNFDVTTINNEVYIYILAGSDTGDVVVKITASNGVVSANANLTVSVMPVPTAVQVKVNSQVVDSTYVMEQWEGRYKQPNVSILPAEANQDYVLSVQSETVSGAFTVDGAKIYFNKPGTGVIRFSAESKSTVYFDLNVKCNADAYTTDTLTYTGTPVSQTFGEAFDSTGLTFKITKSSGEITINKNELSFEPATMEFDTTVVTATHSLSGQTVDINVSVAQPISVSEALTIINGLADGGKTENDYIVKGFVVSANNVSSGSQTYYISDDGTSTNQLQIYKGKGLDGANMTDSFYMGEGDRVVVKGKLEKYMSGSTPKPQVSTGSSVLQASFYYKQIIAWISTNMHMNETDNNGYCKDAEHHYYLTAKAALASLEQECPGAIDIFASDEEADYREALNRYKEWARINGDDSPFDGETTIVNSANISITKTVSNNQTVVIFTIIVSMISVSTLCGFFLLRKRKEEK